MSDPPSIGLRIREARQRKGWTQDQLAQAVDVSRSAVAQWETGRAGQVTGNLTRIATVLDVGVEFLTHGDDKRSPMLATQGNELALLRLYRECAPDDQDLLLRMARRLAAMAMPKRGGAGGRGPVAVATEPVAGVPELPVVTEPGQGGDVEPT